jgi:Long-chain acyl-CoA synthetases (AMP-forming)
VAPQPVETAINESRYIETSALIGNNRKYVIVLVVPQFENVMDWAKKKGIGGERAEVIRHPEVQRLIRQEVEKAVQGFAPHEQPKKVVIMEREWSVETGELTPTLKVRMREIEKKYAEQIEKAYSEDAGAASEVAATAD